MSSRFVPGLTGGVVLAVIGAVLRYGVTATSSDFDLNMIGNILMVAGLALAVIGLITALFDSWQQSHTQITTRDQVHSGDDGSTVHERERVVS